MRTPQGELFFATPGFYHAVYSLERDRVAYEHPSGHPTIDGKLVYVSSYEPSEPAGLHSEPSPGTVEAMRRVGHGDLLGDP